MIKNEKKVQSFRAVKGHEVVYLTLFGTFLVLVILIVLKAMPAGVSSSLAVLRAKTIFQNTLKGTNKDDITNGQDETRIIEVTNNILISIRVSENDDKQIQLPRPAYYFNLQGLNEKDGLYQYLLSLSTVLSELADDPRIDSNSLKVLAYVIADEAAVNHSLYNYGPQMFSETLESPGDIDFKVSRYLESIDITLNQIKSPGFSYGDYYNNITNLNQIDYAIKLMQATNAVLEENYLSEDVKAIAKVFSEQVQQLMDNFVLTISKEAYTDSKVVLVKMVKDSSLDPNTKAALMSSLTAPISEASEATTFINVLRTLFKQNPRQLKAISHEENLLILKAVSTIKFDKLKPINIIMQEELASKIACEKTGGKILNGICISE